MARLCVPNILFIKGAKTGEHPHSFLSFTTPSKLIVSPFRLAWLNGQSNSMSLARADRAKLPNNTMPPTKAPIIKFKVMNLHCNMLIEASKPGFFLQLAGSLKPLYLVSARVRVYINFPTQQKKKGFGTSFGVYQDFYSTHEPFAGSSNIAVIGTTTMASYAEVELLNRHGG